MQRLFDLSFRYKIPLWGSLLIVVTSLSVSAVLMLRAYNDLKSAVVISAQSLGRTMATTLFPSMLHDDVWRAFEIIRAPFEGAQPQNPVQAEAVFVITPQRQIYVSSQPKQLPMLADLRTLGADYALLDHALSIAPEQAPQVIEPRASRHLYVTQPIAQTGAWQGTLVLAYTKSVFYPWFYDSALRGGLFGLLVVAVLLPINWYWGQRMVVPLVRLAQRMDEIPAHVPEDLEPELYAYRDELGRLFEAYNRMVHALRDKAALEHEIVKSARLTALGRLSSGMAHEINNPLAGMLTALDTLKHYGAQDSRTVRTLELLERGLQQIRDTVAALLVQARPQTRGLTPDDIEDVQTLVSPEAEKRGVRIRWQSDLPQQQLVPAGFVRQILVNLLLNAIQAAEPGSEILCAVQDATDALHIEVENQGEPILDYVMEHLFEPFTTGHEGGHGLGLWITYQIVSQLGGGITATNRADGVRFSVRLPYGASA